MIKPITPNEAISHQNNRIPDFVISAVNDLIKAKLVGGKCMLKQDDIVDAIIASSDRPHIERPDGSDANYDHVRGAIFSNHWMDFEQLYRNAGWTVRYDKPHYSESISTCWFTFVAPSN